ncbi:MAG: hypothetical protein AB7E55_32545 [Pigmentiphaga sp.]
MDQSNETNAVVTEVHPHMSHSDMIEQPTFSLTRTFAGRGTAYKITEPDAPAFYLLVTDTTGLQAPQTPEVDTLLMRFFRADPAPADGPVGVLRLQGRAGLIEWYMENVGYSPDDDEAGFTPILELLEQVGAHLLLRKDAEFQMESES